MNFAKRNQPIFIIGLITAIVFAVIIFIGRSTESGITLKETIQNTFSVEERPIPLPPLPESEIQVEPNQPAATQEVQPTLPERPPINLPTVEIFFSEEEGFSPGSVRASKGQIVRWTNNSDREIIIKELIKKHEEFSSGIAIEPFGSYEFKIYGTKLWTFKELGSGEVGRIIIAGN